MLYFIYILSGIGAGIVTGIAGLSAAVVITPLLVGVCGWQSYDAVTVALTADIIASLLTAYTYYKNKNIDLKNGILVAITAFIGTIIGSYCGYLFSQSQPNGLGYISMVTTISLGIKFLVKPIEEGHDAEAGLEHISKNKIIQAMIFGCGIGWICGFVIGAKGICEKYKLYNDIESFNRSVFLSSNAGAGFVIGCVGGVIYKNIWFGIYLYIVQILSALLIFKLQDHKKTYIENVIYDTPIPFFSAIVKAIKVSTGSIITICGFNIFFSTLCDLINIHMGLTVGNILFTINNIIMDFSKGSFCVLELNNKLLCYFLTGFCVGFGGICVHLQIFSECEGYPLNKLKFTILKFMQGFICGLFSLTYSFI